LVLLAATLRRTDAVPNATQPSDVEALKALYRAITNINSTVVSTWNLATDPCGQPGTWTGSWAGVFCSCTQIPSDQVQTCTKDYTNSTYFRVLKLDLGPVTRSSGSSANSGKIQAVLPPELGDLTDLRFLDLSQNQIS
jgi:hypothetical protein